MGSAVFTITVTPVNDASTISGAPAATALQDTLYTFTPIADDVDGETLTFSITNEPGWASFDAGTCTLSGTPGSNDVGTTLGIVISVSDGQLSASLPAFDLTVLADTNNQMYVSTIEVTKRSLWILRSGTARIQVAESGGSPVAGATVYGKWSGGASDTDQFTTGSDGWGTTNSSWLWGDATFSFCVTDIYKENWDYDPDANMTTCEDTD